MLSLRGLGDFVLHCTNASYTSKGDKNAEESVQGCDQFIH